MATGQLTKLPRTRLSGLDFDTVIEDIKTLVMENPDYNANWDNFLESNAGRMLVEMFAWIADQLATRIDWVANENFLSTATQKSSIIRLLKLIGYNLSLPKSALVQVSVTLEKIPSVIGNKIQLTAPYTYSTGYSPFSLVALDKNGIEKNFEAVYYDNVSQVKKFLYTEPVSIDMNAASINAGATFGVDFYEGKTHLETFTVSTDNNQKITLGYSPIIDGSISVYRREVDVENNTKMVELLKVDNFLDRKAQTYYNIVDTTTNAIPYIINIKENNTAEIEFGPTSILKEANRRPTIGDNIVVIYRVGGGINGNITERSINVTKVINGTQALFVNNYPGVGGQDSEDINNAIYQAPLSIRTSNKTVTVEDYDVVLQGIANALLTKSFGSNNMPGNFYDTYGVYINPQEVWNFIALKKSGWENINPSEYNKFKWVDLRIENRFNEEINFNNGEFNVKGEKLRLLSPYTEDAITHNAGTSIFKNYSVIVPPTDFINNIYAKISEESEIEVLNRTVKIILTKEPTPEILFSEVADSGNSSNWFIKSAAGETPYISLEEGNEALSVKEDTFAEIFGGAPLATVSLGANNVLGEVSFDHRKYIDNGALALVSSGINNTFTVEELAKKINEEVSIEYNGLDGVTVKDYAYGYHRVPMYTTNDPALTPLTVVENLGVKTESELLTGIVGYDEKMFTISLGLTNTSDVETEVDVTFSIDETNCPPLAGESQYDISGVFNNKSFVDIVKIINRALGRDNIDVRARLITPADADLDAPGDNDTCYNIYFEPVDGSSIKAVRVIYENGVEDTNNILWYLSAQSAGSFSLPLEVKAADYRNVASVIAVTISGTTRKYLYIKSPVEGELYSSIKITPPNNYSCLNTIFGYAVGGEAIGVRRINIISNINSSERGRILYETNMYFVPSYYYTETPVYKVNLNTAAVTTEEVFLRNTFYYNYIRDPKEKLLVGNTTEYFTPETVHNLYNSVFTNGELDTNLSEFVLKFTKEKVFTNSIYSIGPEDSSYLPLTQTDFASITSRNFETITPGYFAADDVIRFSIDFDDTVPGDEENKTVTVSLNVTSITGLYTDIISELTLYGYEFPTNLVKYDPVNGTVTIKNDRKDSKGIIKFYGDTPEAISGFNKLFASPMINASGHDIRPTGDYYVTFEEGSVYLNKMPGSVNIPDSKIYFHYLNDRRNELYIGDKKIVLDEDVLLDYLYPYKILGMENVIKSPLFRTFDIKGRVYYSSNKSKETIQTAVEQALNTEYSIENASFGRSIIKSQIFKTIHEIEGVKYAEINYLGFDYESLPGVDNIISSNFDEIVVLSEPIYNEDGTTQLHGLMLEYFSVVE